MKNFISLAVITLAGVGAATIPARAAQNQQDPNAPIVSDVVVLDKPVKYSMNDACDLSFDPKPFVPLLKKQPSEFSMVLFQTVGKMVNNELKIKPACSEKGGGKIVANAGTPTDVGLYTGKVGKFDLKVSYETLQRTLGLPVKKAETKPSP